MKEISGGVVAAKGFQAAGIRVGVKASALPMEEQTGEGKKDLCMVLSDSCCSVAGMFTTNQVKAAPVRLTREHIASGYGYGVIANSGNANACAPNSRLHALEMCRAAAEATGHQPEEFAVCSTGVIGQELNVKAILEGTPRLVAALHADECASDEAARAIMTTDTVKKEIAVETMVGGKRIAVGGIAKGSGMIHPNMGTMLSFVTTDCAVSPAMLDRMVHEIVPRTFNRVTVDGDTSTNDTFLVFANGQGGNETICQPGEDYESLKEALMYVCTQLARKMAADGEGASRLITCLVEGARSEETAERLAKAVVGSSLVKAAMFGADANWGRVICAMGYSKAPFRPEYVDIKFASSAGEVLVCQQGNTVAFDETLAKKVLTQPEITIAIHVHDGDSSAECWGCDLTYDYVKINGDYRT